MIETVTLLLVLAGYTTVVMYGLTLAVRLSAPLARLRAAVTVIPALGWVAFYLWTTGIAFNPDATYTAARLASRLHHLPTIGALLVLQRILQVEQTAYRDAGRERRR